ncbi:MAG: hypothetical protein V1778_05425 [bacterium]
MYLTTHAAVGVVISKAMGTPALALPVAFLSHFVLDAIPHGDERVARWVTRQPKKGFVVGILDATMLMLLIAFIVGTQRNETIGLLLAGIFGALLPDFITNIFPFLHRETRWFRSLFPSGGLFRRGSIGRMLRKHDLLHEHIHNPLAWEFSLVQGFVLQGLIIVISLIGRVALSNNQ